MRTIHDMQPEVGALCEVLEKYSRICRIPLDIGTGEKLYPQEVHVISAVVVSGHASVSELSARFGATKGAASQMVGKLVKKGFLTKRRDPDKGSRLIVEATDMGRSVHEAHMGFHAEHDKFFFNWLSGLCTEEYRVFSALCGEMNRWMDGYLKSAPGSRPEGVPNGQADK